MEDNKTKKTEVSKEAAELIEQYNGQTEDENIHHYHVDGYYGDYSDCCSC